MNIITIDIHESYGMYSARAAWGQSSWHRDPITGISELFGQAIKYAQVHSAEDVVRYDPRLVAAKIKEEQIRMQMEAQGIRSDTPLYGNYQKSEETPPAAS